MAEPCQGGSGVFGLPSSPQEAAPAGASAAVGVNIAATGAPVRPGGAAMAADHERIQQQLQQQHEAGAHDQHQQQLLLQQLHERLVQEQRRELQQLQNPLQQRGSNLYTSMSSPVQEHLLRQHLQHKLQQQQRAQPHDLQHQSQQQQTPSSSNSQQEQQLLHVQLHQQQQQKQPQAPCAQPDKPTVPVSLPLDQPQLQQQRQLVQQLQQVQQQLQASQRPQLQVQLQLQQQHRIHQQLRQIDESSLLQQQLIHQRMQQQHHLQQQQTSSQGHEQQQGLLGGQQQLQFRRQQVGQQQQLLLREQQPQLDLQLKQELKQHAQVLQSSPGLQQQVFDSSRPDRGAAATAAGGPSPSMEVMSDPTSEPGGVTALTSVPQAAKLPAAAANVVQWSASLGQAYDEGTAGQSQAASGAAAGAAVAAASSNMQWAKYGESHSAEAAVPAAFLWPSADGCWCGYAADFLLYNKTAERLLPVEALDSEEPGDVVMYAKLVNVSLVHPPHALVAANHPVCAEVYPHLLWKGRQPSLAQSRCRKGAKTQRQQQGTADVNRQTVAHLQHQPQHGGMGEKPEGSSSSSSAQGACEAQQDKTSQSGWMQPKLAKHLKTFSVRVELRDWRISYGDTPNKIPSLWCASVSGRQYRLEKPAGRYATLFTSCRRKFEVAARVIPQLYINPNTTYDELRGLLTAAEEAKQRMQLQPQMHQQPSPLYQSCSEAERFPSAADTAAPSMHTDDDMTDDPREQQQQQQLQQQMQLQQDHCTSPARSSSRGSSRCFARPPRQQQQRQDQHQDPTLVFAHAKLISGLCIRKGKGNHLPSLCDPDGTGVRELADGSTSPSCSWGAAFAVDGCTEVYLISIARFLLTQVAAFEATLNGGYPSSASGPGRLVYGPFCQVLAEKAAAANVYAPPFEYLLAPDPAAVPDELLEQQDALQHMLVQQQLHPQAAEAEPCSVVSLPQAGANKGGVSTGRGAKRSRRQRGDSQDTTAAAGAGVTPPPGSRIPCPIDYEAPKAYSVDATAALQATLATAGVHQSQQLLFSGRQSSPQPPEMKVPPSEAKDELLIDPSADPMCQRRPLPLSQLMLYRHPELLELQDFLRVFAEYMQMLPPQIETLEAALLRPAPPILLHTATAVSPQHGESPLHLKARLYELADEILTQEQPQTDVSGKEATTAKSDSATGVADAGTELKYSAVKADEVAAVETGIRGSSGQGKDVKVEAKKAGKDSEARSAAPETDKNEALEDREGMDADETGSEEEEAEQARRQAEAARRAAAEAAAADAAAAAVDNTPTVSRAARLPFFLGDALLLRLLQLGVLQLADAMQRAPSASSASAEETLSPDETLIPASLWLGVDVGLHKQPQHQYPKKASSGSASGGHSQLTNACGIEADSSMYKNKLSGVPAAVAAAAAAAASFFECLAGGRSELLQQIRRLLPQDAQNLAEEAQQQQQQLPRRALRALDGLPLDIRLLDPLTAPLLLKRLMFECMYTPRRTYISPPRQTKQEAFLHTATSTQEQLQQQQPTKYEQLKMGQQSEHEQSHTQLEHILNRGDKEQQHSHEQNRVEAVSVVAAADSGESAARMDLSSSPDAPGSAAAASRKTDSPDGSAVVGRAASNLTSPSTDKVGFPQNSMPAEVAEVEAMEEDLPAPRLEATASSGSVFATGDGEVLTEPSSEAASQPVDAPMHVEGTTAATSAAEPATPAQDSSRRLPAGGKDSFTTSPAGSTTAQQQGEAESTREMPSSGGEGDGNSNGYPSSSSCSVPSHGGSSSNSPEAGVDGDEDSAEGSSVEGDDDREEDEETAAAAAAAAGGTPVVEWAVDPIKAETCGVDSSIIERHLLALHALRCGSFWLLPRDVRCCLLQRLQRFVCDGWQGKYFLDVKLDSLARARLNLLRLKAAATQPAEEEQHAAVSGFNATAASADAKAEKEIEDGAAAEEGDGNTTTPAAAPEKDSAPDAPVGVKEETADDATAGTASTTTGPRAHRRKPMGRVTNAEAEKLQACFVVRTEPLGEDRYLNRYFACIAPSGNISRIYVEALCDPSPLRLLAQKASKAAEAAAAFSYVSISSTCYDGQDERDDQPSSNSVKSQRLASDAFCIGSSNSIASNRSALRVFPPSDDCVSLFSDGSLSEWPITRRPIKVESLAAFLHMLQLQQHSVCFFVSPNTAVLQQLRDALSPSLKRERVLRASLGKAIEEVEAEQQQPAAVPPVIPPSPLAAAVWLGCKLLHALNELLLTRCYPLLWRQQQLHQLSPSAAVAGALTVLSRAAGCSSIYPPDAVPLKHDAAADATTAAVARRQHQRYWMEQSLFVGVLTQLLLHMEALVDAAGSVHAESWLYRRHQWAADLERLSLRLPVLLPPPGQQQEIPDEAARPRASATKKVETEKADARRKRVKKLEDLEAEPQEARGGHTSPRDGGSNTSPLSPASGDSLEKDATTEATDAAKASQRAADTHPATDSSPAGNDAGLEDSLGAPLVATPLCSISDESIATAVSAAAAAPAAADAAATAAIGDMQEAAAEARFRALVQCMCCGFGWDETQLLQLLDQLYEQAFYSSATATPTDSGTSAEEMQWLDVRRRLDLIHLWGLYANVWKSTGLDCQRLADLNAPIDRESFEQLLASDSQRQQIPRVGDSVMFFRKGHSEVVNTLLQEQAAQGCSYARTCCTLKVPELLGWIEELRVHHIDFFAGFAGLLPPHAAVQPPLASAASMQHNALHAIPCGSAEAAGVGLLAPLFAFALEEDPIVLGLAKPIQQQQQQRVSRVSVAGGGEPGAAQNSTARRDSSHGCNAASSVDDTAAPDVNPVVATSGSSPAELSAPEGLVSPVIEDFLLQADPLRLASKSGAAAQAYLQEQLRLQQLLQEQLLQQGGELPATEALDASLCPHYRVVCSVATRTHPSAADAAVECLESLAATAAAASESRLTRTSSRLAKGGPGFRAKHVEEPKQQQQTASQTASGAEGNDASVVGRLSAASPLADGGVLASQWVVDHDRAGLPLPAQGPQLLRRWVVLSVPLLPGSSSFLLQRSKVVQSLELGWSPGMRFRMQIGCCPAAAAAAAATLPPVPRGLGLAVLDFSLQQQHQQQLQQRLSGIIRRTDATPAGLWGGVYVDWEEKRNARPGEAAAVAVVAAASAATSVSLWDLEPLKRLKRPGTDS